MKLFKNCYVFLAPLLVLGWLPAAQAQAPPSYTVTTIAGNGGAGFEGDSGPALEAALNYPAGVAVKADGTIYIADALNRRIRRVDGSGTITTVAGNGERGQDGENGPALSAQFSSPYGIAIASNGDLYIADSLSSWIRRVSGSNINTVAGSLTGYAGDGGPAVDGALNTPIGLAVGPDGVVYVADTFNNRIRKITTDGILTTIAGDGRANRYGDEFPAVDAALWHPEDIAVDSAGNLYIADTFNHKIRKISTDGIITTFAGNFNAGFSGDGGPATQASLNYPKGVAVDQAGNVYIADTHNSRIRVVTEDGRIYTIAGNGRFDDKGEGGPGGSAELRFPSSVAVGPDGRVYFADTDNGKIKVLTPTQSVPLLSDGGAVSPSAYGGFAASAPGSWLEIYGSNLSARLRQWSENDFVDAAAPTSLGGTSVTIGGREAAVSFVSPGQVNVLVPSGVAAGDQEVVVHTAYGDSEPSMVEVHPTQPGLLAPPSFRVGERQYVAALVDQGPADAQLAGQIRYALPVGAIEGVDSRPARPGDTIVLYGVGFGPVAPNLGSDRIVQQDNSLALPLEVYFGDTRAAVTYAGLAQGNLGLYQFNVEVPAVTAGDAVPLSFVLAGEAGQQDLVIAIGN